MLSDSRFKLNLLKKKKKGMKEDESTCYKIIIKNNIKEAHEKPHVKK